MVSCALGAVPMQLHAGLPAPSLAQTRPCCRRLLFAKDFRGQVEAAELLTGRLEPESSAVQACVDLLLQWTAARICDGNTAALLAVLGFAKALLQHLASQAGPKAVSGV